jgi:hypothetical protein
MVVRLDSITVVEAEVGEGEVSLTFLETDERAEAYR